jgi:hypothetical protein
MANDKKKTTKESKAVDPVEEEIMTLKGELRQEVEEELKRNIFYGLNMLLENSRINENLARTNYSFRQYAFYASLILLVVAILGWTRSSEYVYIIQSPDGSVHEASTTGGPVITNRTLQTFASEVAAGLHTFSYRNYLESFRAMREYCEDEVITDIFTRLQDTGVFTKAQDFSQRYESIATSMQLVQQFPLTNPIRWELRGVISEEIISASGKKLTNNIDMVIHIHRVPLEESFRGIKCYKVQEQYSRGLQ